MPKPVITRLLPPQIYEDSFEFPSAVVWILGTGCSPMAQAVLVGDASVFRSYRLGDDLIECHLDVYGSASVGARHFRRGVSDEQRRAVIELLHDAAAKPIPAKASMPDILTYQIDRDDNVETSSTNSKSLCVFVVASIRGEDVDGYYDEYL